MPQVAATPRTIWIYTCLSLSLGLGSRVARERSSCCHLAVKWWHKRTYALTHQWGGHTGRVDRLQVALRPLLALTLRLSLSFTPRLAHLLLTVLIGTSVTSRREVQTALQLCLLIDSSRASDGPERERYAIGTIEGRQSRGKKNRQRERCNIYVFGIQKSAIREID